MKKRRSKPVRMAIAGGIFLCICLAFLGIFPWLLQGQAVPALLKFTAMGAVGALAVLVGLVAATLLFGRFYCSLICPLGFLQDLVGMLSKGQALTHPALATVRYVLAGLAFGLFAGGWAGGLLLLDPYSTFGRLFTCSSIAGVGALVLLVVLTVWRRRFFCATLCPVGTLLGLLAKRGLFHLTLSEHCIQCGVCAKTCPSGCIDVKQRVLDNERCVRCMACHANCPVGAITFTATTRPPAPTNASRRAFLINGTGLVAGLGAGFALAKCGLEKLEDWGRRTRILPPGAGNPRRFAATCTACQRCVQACPTGVIVPARGGLGPVSLDLSRGACTIDCNRCSQVCPTGAIVPLTLHEKRHTQIAIARLDAKKCRVFQDGEECGDCATACPKRAITLRKSGAPYPVNARRCIGCGACLAACPSQYGKALTLIEIDEQVRIGKKNV